MGLKKGVGFRRMGASRGAEHGGEGQWGGFGWEVLSRREAETHVARGEESGGDKRVG